MYEIISFYLNNGLKVIMHKIPKCKVMSCGVWVKQGSKYEDDNINGLSHLVEHLLVNPADTMNERYKEIMNEITFNGVEYNATTTKESTGFYFTGLSKMLNLSLRALSNIVIHNKEITQEQFIVEKNVVEQEAISYYSSFNQIRERTSQALWGNIDIGKIIVGNIDIVKKCELHQIKELIDNSYTPENSILAVIGDIDYDDTLKMIEEYFSDWDDTETREYKEIINSEVGVYLNNNPGKNSVISLGFRIPSKYSESNSSVDIISTILGYPGLESRIVKEIRIKRGLAYNLNSFTSLYKNKGTLGFTVICANESTEEVVKVLIDEVKKAKEYAFEDDEIKKAKNILQTKAILDINDITKHLRFLASNACNNNIFSLENEIRKIMKCNSKMIFQAADDIFTNENMGFAGIGNFNFDKVAELLQF